jgi:hypothetical protein
MNKLIALSLIVSASACSFIARDTETYKKDTRSTLEGRSSDIKACYDSALAANPSQSGSVVVTFIVEKKTGTFANVAADPNQSTAPEGLQNCVVKALEGLKLAEPDQREGQATFQWSFDASGAGKPVEEAPAADDAAAADTAKPT